eukprot:4669061-Prymnesium_polylepis.1
MSSETRMRTQMSVCPERVLRPEKHAEHPETTESDVPPTTRPESGEAQLSCSLKYMPMRAFC